MSNDDLFWYMPEPLTLPFRGRNSLSRSIGNRESPKRANCPLGISPPVSPQARSKWRMRGFGRFFLAWGETGYYRPTAPCCPFRMTIVKVLVDCVTRIFDFGFLIFDFGLRTSVFWLLPPPPLLSSWTQAPANVCWGEWRIWLLLLWVTFFHSFLLSKRNPW